jgi:hypothetical protein
MQHLGRTAIVSGARQRSIDTARLSFVASNPREGRVMRACRRALIALGACHTRDLLEWAYPGAEREFWHYKSIYRAAQRYAVKDGRLWLPATCTRHVK